MRRKKISDIIYLYNNNKEQFYKTLLDDKKLNNYKNVILDKDCVRKYFIKFKNFEKYSEYNIVIENYYIILREVFRKYIDKDSNFLNKNLDSVTLLFCSIFDRKEVFKDINNTPVILDICIDIITLDFEKYKDNPLFYAILNSPNGIEIIFKMLIDIISNKNINNLDTYIFKFKNNMISNPFIKYGEDSLIAYMLLIKDSALYDSMSMTNSERELILKKIDMENLIKFNLLLFLNSKFKNCKSYNNEYNIKNNNEFIDVFSDYIYFIIDSYDDLLSWLIKKSIIKVVDLKKIYKQHKKNMIKVKQKNHQNKNKPTYAEKLPIETHIKFTFSFFKRFEGINFAYFNYFYDLMGLIGVILSVQRTNYFYFTENKEKLENSLYGDMVEYEYLDMEYTKNLENILNNFYNEDYNFFNSNLYLSIYIERKIKKIMIDKNIKFNKNDTLSPCIRKLFKKFENKNVDNIDRLIRFYEGILTNNHTTPLNIRNSFGHLSNLSETFNSRLCSDILIFLYYMLPK